MIPNHPRARDCIRDVLLATQRADADAARRSVEAYLAKTDLKPAEYQHLKLGKLLQLAREAGVYNEVLGPAQTRQRATAAAVNIFAPMAAAPIAAPVPAVPVVVAPPVVTAGPSGIHRRPLPAAQNAQQPRRLPGLPALPAAASGAPLPLTVRVSSLQSAPVARPATPVSAGVQTLPVLPGSVAARVNVATAAQNRLGATLRDLSAQGRNITTWLRVGTVNHLVHAPFVPASEGDTPGYGSLSYQVLTRPVGERLDLLDAVEKAHQVIVGLALDDANDTLTALTRTLPAGTPVPAMRIVTQDERGLEHLGQKGYIAAIVQRRVGAFSAAAGRAEFIVALVDSGERYRHVANATTLEDLASTVSDIGRRGHDICGIVQEESGALTLITRSCAQGQPTRGFDDTDAQRIALARAAVLGGDETSALQALADLAQAASQKASTWQRNAGPLHALLQALPTEPWRALSGVAQLQAAAADEDAFAYDMAWLCRRWGERAVSDPTPAFLSDIKTLLPSLAQQPRALLTKELANICSVGASSFAPNALERIITKGWVGRAAVVAALCGDTLVHASSVGGTSLYEKACATGNPCLAAAVDGNVYALDAWKRMTPAQQKILVELGQLAHSNSIAKTNALRARIAMLLPGADPHTLANSLRTYLRREADLWINFKPSTARGALNALNYLPKSTGREVIEQKRFNGLYDKSENAGQQRPIYAFVNAQHAVHGFTKYGHAAFVLRQSIRPRVTIITRKHHDSGKRIGTLYALDHILMDLDDSTFHQILAAMSKEKSRRPLLLEQSKEVTSNVIEAHVHGPLSVGNEVRKLVVSPSYGPTPADIANLQHMAARYDLPLRYRGHLESPDDTPNSLHNLLDLASTLGVHVADWSWVAAGDKRKHIFAMQGSADGRAKSPYIYDFLGTTLLDFNARITMLAREGVEVAAFRVDAFTGRGAQSARKVSAIVRRSAFMGKNRTVGLRRTFLLEEKLKQLRDTGWRVQALSAVPVPDSRTPHYHLVVEQLQDAKQTYESHVVHLPKHPAAWVVENAVASAAKARWKWAGFSSYSQDGAPASMLFERPAQRPPSWPQPYINETTLINDDPIGAIPQSLLFVSDSNHAFDIDELMDAVEVRGAWVNPYTGSPFSEAEVARLLAHPSNAGPAMAARLKSESTGIVDIGTDTATRLIALGKTLEKDNPKGTLDLSTREVEDFQAHVRTLPAAEQTALFGARFQLRDTHQSEFALSAMQVIIGVQTREGCSRATGRYLQQIGRQVLAARSVP